LLVWERDEQWPRVSRAFVRVPPTGDVESVEEAHDRTRHATVESKEGDADGSRRRFSHLRKLGSRTPLRNEALDVANVASILANLALPRARSPALAAFAPSSSLLAVASLAVRSYLASRMALAHGGGFMEIRHRFVESNGLRMHIAEAGTGPLVLLCHGFPEGWYSFRHQLEALSEAGFHAVAPDQRGYGETTQPEPVDAYTFFHLIGDLVGLLDALSESAAFLVGHDWGATVAWLAAMMRPDRFPAVVGLSVPFLPRSPAPPTQVLPQREDAVYYQLYFQTPGVEAELSRDPYLTMRRLLFLASGDAPRPGALSEGLGFGMIPRSGFLELAPDPATLPAWLAQADIDHFGRQFERSGFRGALNWFRNMDRNWELLAPWSGAKVTVPALYVTGDQDLVLKRAGMAQFLENLARYVPGLRRKIVLPGCGHWTQQERPSEVNDALLSFLREVSAETRTPNEGR
jgi:pimeloyl-ACP methyl ester carboxylesterase